MRIGPYQVFSLEVGRLALDGGAMFGVVPKTLWSKTCPADENNRVQLSTRVLLIMFEDRKLLVDAGCGHKFPSKYREIYQIDYSSGDLESALARHGLGREQITDVILTHCHFDHMGGATRLNGGSLELTFPTAIHYVQRCHWQWALNPTEKDRASFLEENIGPFLDHPHLKLLDGPEELYPGLHLLLSNGHTVGLQMVKIQDAATSLLFCSDLLPAASHLPLPFLMGYDLHPLTTLEEKRKYLTQACDENWILALEHDPHHAAIRIRKGEKNLEILESLTL